MEALPVILSALLAATLLTSGVGKMVSPRGLAAALGELAGSRRPPVILIRAVASVEIALAALATFNQEHVLTFVLAVALGASFVLVGVAGRLRASSLPCGCFGRTGSRSFGGWNVLAGAAVMAWAMVPALRETGHDQAALLLALNITVVVPVWANRRYLSVFVRGTMARERTES
ncbi:MauE/DoxX family redox-associated membrane protein [Nonomuraea sp. NPDC048916]|uniref:MauE/DoxX family redox-associated membrane protein n=1 Tax=Nonomuraea sp. NPDC048916 TaxID=3154232 RepID=UPI0033EBC8D0